MRTSPHRHMVPPAARARIQPRRRSRNSLLITPAAASRARSLDAFFPRGRTQRAGHWRVCGVTPEQATAALRDVDKLLDSALENRFQPAREQLQLATVFALYRALL